MARNIHVIPSSGKWSVRKEGEERASRVFGSRSDAISFAKERAKDVSGEIIIHGRDGRIRDRHSYGADPRPPRDRQH